MEKRTERTARHFNIMENIEKLENELLKIDRVTKIDFDLDGFYDSIGQVIFLTKYDIPAEMENYFEVRKQLLENVIKVAKENGLTRTEDRIEDYGEWFYFVMKHNNEWNRI